MNDITIQVKDLKKSFKTTEVLKGVDFNVRHGEIFALLGSNGAGKTTIAKILSTLLKSDSGSASVCGFDVLRQPEKVRENISLTGQFTAVDEVLTGRENLKMIAKLRGIANADKLADNLLERFGLRDAENRYPARRRDYCKRNAHRTQKAVPAHKGRIHRKTADPGGNISSHHW